MSFDKLFLEIENRLIDGRVVIAIEGGSASGKSTLSEVLLDRYECSVIHMDDFFLRLEQRTKDRLKEIGGNIDKERFIEEVLPSLRNDKLCFRKFDCQTMTLGEENEVTLNKLVVIEGVYSMHPEFGKYYDLAVFLDISEEKQKERILKRNSPEFAKRFFEEWIPLEEKYFEKTNIKNRSDLVIKI